MRSICIMIEIMPRLRETSEPKGSMENVNVKLRKSFSWDRSFFTNDGVLDAEELSSMIEGGGKDVKQQLQVIEEKLCSSMESISTLENDKFALENLEAKFFDDIKASPQKTSRTANLTNSSIKVSSREKDSQEETSSSSKQADLAFEKRPATSTNIKGNPTSTRTSKTDSSSPNLVKDDHVIQKGAQTSKLTGVISPHRAVPTTSLSSRLTSKLTSKLSFLGSSTPIKTGPPKSSPLSGGSTNSSGTKTLKTSFSSTSKPPSSSSTSIFSRKIISRKKVDTKTNKPSVGSTQKTPSRIILKNKSPPVSSRLPSFNLSESSSPPSTVSQRSISRGSRGTSVHNRSLERNASYKPAVESHSNGRNLDRSGKQPPTQTGSLSRPRSVLSTGRGMPSTRTGFFDGGNSRTPKQSTRNQTRVQSLSPKTNRNRNSNGAKTRKLPPLNSRKTNTIKPSQEQSRAKTRHSSSASRGTKTILVNSPEVLDMKGKINALRNEIGMQKIVSRKG